MNPEIQAQLDTLIAEVKSKFEGEKQAALDAQKVEFDATLANQQKETGAAIVAHLKSGFGLPG